MAEDVRIETVASRPLAVVRRRASLAELSRVIPAACGAVWNVVREQKLTGVGRNVAIYRDEVINLEVGVELESPVAVQGEVVGSSTPAGPVATITHFGPYGGLGEAHRAVRDFCEAQGYRRAGPCWEIYGHWQDAWVTDPSQIRTDVYYLLRADRSDPGAG